MISTKPSCAYNQQIPLGYTTWPPELKIEKSCLAFTAQIVGGILMKFYMNDQYKSNCACFQHVPLDCTTWKLELKIEKSS